MALVSKAFGDIITFTRASTGSYFDSAGVLQSAAINAPRLDYNPSTLAAQGLLIEEQRTNSIRNNTMVGAVAGTPGTNPTNWSGFTAASGLTREIVGTGSEAGVNYIDFRFSGTASSFVVIFGAFDSTNPAAASGQSWTASFYVKLQAGSTTNINAFQLRIDELDSGGNLLTNSVLAISPTSAALTTQRSVISRTFNNASTAFARAAIRFEVSSGLAIDITLRIGLPQLEQGAFATSVIPTSTVAVTRSADVASVNTLSPWYNQTEGTLYVESAAIAFTARPASFNDGTQNNAIGLTQTAAAIGQNTYVGNVFQGTAGVAGTYTTNTVYKQASAYKLNDAQDAVNGTINATDTTFGVPAVTQMLIGQGRAGATQVTNSWIRRITYYPRRLSNAELQAITA